ncbi:MAG: hypothetical protein JWM74_998 [Myxococcaceae bacterium]|nr:hypothetical protein [Myxococcaceae bacterium]
MSTPTEEKSATPKTNVLVKKSITVNASAARAFEVFTKDMTSWWPLATHHISKVDAKEAVIEPFVNGRWFERGVDGSECDWGTVLAWDPPSRVVLAWQLTADWKYDASFLTEVEVRFTPEGAGTRVDLEHRLHERYGDRTEEIRKALDSDDGWTGMLRAYGNRASNSTA